MNLLHGIKIYPKLKPLEALFLYDDTEKHFLIFSTHLISQNFNTSLLRWIRSHNYMKIVRVCGTFDTKSTK